jgi:DNA-binding ferritin-like protein
MAKSLFPDEMMKSGELNLEIIAGKLTYFHEQLHLLHWQTKSYAQHKALGKIYEYVQDFKDDVVEKLMGYTGKRPGAIKLEQLTATDPNAVVTALMDFASNLKRYAEANSYHDIANLADALSGEAAKTKYLLTLS